MNNINEGKKGFNKNTEGKEGKLFLGKFRRIDIIHKLIGVVLILIALFIFIFSTIWVLISKMKSFNQQENSAIINFIIEDRHYCIALPLLIPISLLVFYFRWMFYNYFKYS